LMTPVVLKSSRTSAVVRIMRPTLWQVQTNEIEIRNAECERRSAGRLNGRGLRSRW
jgi:hypothetical protein